MPSIVWVTKGNKRTDFEGGVTIELAKALARAESTLAPARDDNLGVWARGSVVVDGGSQGAGAAVGATLEDVTSEVGRIGAGVYTLESDAVVFGEEGIAERSANPGSDVTTELELVYILMGVLTIGSKMEQGGISYPESKVPLAKMTAKSAHEPQPFSVSEDWRISSIGEADVRVAAPAARMAAGFILIRGLILSRCGVF